MVYTVKGNRNKGFTLNDEANNLIGHLEFHNWYSKKATISLVNSESVEISTSGFWQSTYELVKAEHKIGELKMNWKGHFNITLNGVDYQYKWSGFWMRSFALMQGDQRIAQVKQRYEWTKLSYVFEIIPDDLVRNNDMPVLMLVMAYCTSQQYASAGAV
jgi:hypothetical protein